MKVFLDSNIFIKFSKNMPKAVMLVKELFKNLDVEIFINDVVYSEVSFIFIRVHSEKSYFELKKNKKVVIKAGQAFLNKLFPMLKLVKFLEIKENIINLANNYIVTYGLLPNDALILATCKYYGINCLISLDEDFRDACEKEKITFISSIDTLKKNREI